MVHLCRQDMGYNYNINMINTILLINGFQELFFKFIYKGYFSRSKFTKFFLFFIFFRYWKFNSVILFVEVLFQKYIEVFVIFFMLFNDIIDSGFIRKNELNGSHQMGHVVSSEEFFKPMFLNQCLGVPQAPSFFIIV